MKTTRSSLDANSIIILIDTREQWPLQFPGMKVERDNLKTGDYSCVANGVDLRDTIAVERKSLGDLLGRIGTSRERFERELARLAKLPYRALVIEAGMTECAAASHRYSQLKPQHVIGSTMGWWLKRRPVDLCRRPGSCLAGGPDPVTTGSEIPCTRHQETRANVLPTATADPHLRLLPALRAPLLR